MGRRDHLPVDANGAPQEVDPIGSPGGALWRQAGPDQGDQPDAVAGLPPDDLRQQLRGLTIPKLVRRAAAFRPGGRSDVTAATRLALRTLAHRVLELNTEVAALDNVLKPLVAATAPDLVAHVGVGTDTAGALLVAAGENTSRLRNERSFARLCGAAPLDASSGKQQRHRLSRAGDEPLA